LFNLDELPLREFQKIIDYDGLVWNCWTGALTHLGVARANALQARGGTRVSPVQAKQSSAADRDAARTRALAAYRDFLALWKNADLDIPIRRKPKPSTRSCSSLSFST
jgi:eukaryotic-like serine/threonine-protein kinase